MTYKTDNRSNSYTRFFSAGILTIVLLCTAAAVCGTAGAATIYVPDGQGTIQAAVTAATAGDTIIVRDGTYNENVDVNTAHLTIRSENGTAKCIVQAQSASDHVFEVAANYVNISGFTATGATGGDKAGIGLGGEHCNISDNNATNNCFGIYLYFSSNNNLTNNTANLNNCFGIYLYFSSNNNNLTNNTANLNNGDGIGLAFSSNNNNLTNNTANLNNGGGIGLAFSSNNNNLTKNTANLNTHDGIGLAFSSNNNLTNNTANLNNYYGIYLYFSSNNNLTNNTANLNNDYGIRLYYSSNNNLTSNIANSNNGAGIYLNNADDNNISCNWVQNNKDTGFYLFGGSTGNTIESNNIIANGGLQLDGSYHYQFYNRQTNPVEAKHNYWGPGMVTNETIDPSIRDNEEGRGTVTFYPFRTDPAPCAPIPELSTVLLFAVGLLMLAGYVRIGRRK